MADIKDQHETSPGIKRILIVDDHPVVRQGLAQFINLEPDLEVRAEAGTAKEAIEAVEKQKFDLAIVDMLLENTTGVQVTEKIRLRFPNLPVLIFSMSDDLYYVKRALGAGARGYITKDEISDNIINAIRQVFAGKIYLSNKLIQKFPKSELDNLLQANIGDCTG